MNNDDKSNEEDNSFFPDIDNDFYKYLADENAEEDGSAIRKQGPTIVEEKTIKPNKKKSNSLFNSFEPNLNEQHINATKTFVSFHMDSNALTYTRFEIVNDTSLKIDDWKYKKISASNKSLHENIDEITTFVDDIPESDTYVMEKQMKVQSKAGLKSILSSIHFNQRLTALVLLLTKKYQKNLNENFYFMPNLFMGRLFKLIIGHEITSSRKETEKILRELCYERHDIILGKEIRDAYFKSTAVEKEYLGRTMLFGLTFYCLAILKCSNSIDIVKYRNL